MFLKPVHIKAKKIAQLNPKCFGSQMVFALLLHVKPSVAIRLGILREF